jgi:hypothetical protein
METTQDVRQFEKLWFDGLAVPLLEKLDFESRSGGQDWTQASK